MKWEVQITGDKNDLKELSKSLNDDELRIVEKEGQFFLESSRLDNLTNAGEVKSVTTEIMPILTGAVRLSLGGRTPMLVGSVARIREDGGRDIFVSISETIHLRETIGIEIQKSDGTIKVINPANNVPKWIQLGLNNMKVAKALRLFGAKVHNWVSLYRLYEVIEEDIGGIDKIANLGWATKASLKRFKHTANSPGAVGDASRHGKESTIPPTKPMDLSEARSLIELILHNWLGQKTGE